MLHTTKKMKKKFFLFGANIFLENIFGKKLYYDGHTTILRYLKYGLQINIRRKRNRRRLFGLYENLKGGLF
jgi:hypothetical protein